MAVSDLLHSITESLQSSATVKKVYGEPVAAEGKTIIPIAKVRYGFGAGGGNKNKKTDDSNASGPQEGGGGGGGVVVIPVGYIEIGEKYSEYVPISDSKKSAALLAGGIVLGAIIGSLIGTKKWFK